MALSSKGSFQVVLAGTSGEVPVNYVDHCYYRPMLDDQSLGTTATGVSAPNAVSRVPSGNPSKTEHSWSPRYHRGLGPSRLYQGVRLVLTWMAIPSRTYYGKLEGTSVGSIRCGNQRLGQSLRTVRVGYKHCELAHVNCKRSFTTWTLTYLK